MDPLVRFEVVILVLALSLTIGGLVIFRRHKAVKYTSGSRVVALLMISIGVLLGLLGGFYYLLILFPSQPFAFLKVGRFAHLSTATSATLRR